jgi:O-antigen/teichoic acid export membrane protein
MRTDRRPPVEASEGAGSAFWRSRTWWNRLGQSTVATGIAAGLTILSVVVAARALGPEGYGSVVLALSVTAVAARFLDFTFEEAVVHHGHRALAERDFSGLRELLRMAMMLDLAVGVVIAGALAALAAPLGEIAAAGGIDPSLVRLAALGVLVVTVDGTSGAVLLVASRPHLSAWIQAAASLFRVIGTLAAVGLGGGAEAILISYAVSGALASLLLGAVAWRVAWRRWAQAPRGALPVSVPRLLRFGFHSSATTSIAAVGQSIFPVILGNLAGTAAVGTFRVAMLPVLAADMLSRPLRLMIFPEQARLFAHRRIIELRRAVRAYTLIGVAIALPAAVIGWFAMPTLIELLFSSSFEGAVAAARILLIAAVVHFPLAWSKSFHAAVGRPHIRTRLSALYLALSLGLLLLLGDRGAEGAAIAYTIATVSTASVWVVVAHRYLGREVSAAQEVQAEELVSDEELPAEVGLPAPAGGR